MYKFSNKFVLSLVIDETLISTKNMKLTSTSLILLLLINFTIGQIIRIEYQENRQYYLRKRCTYDGHQVDLYDRIPFGYPRCGLYECIQRHTMKITICEKNGSRGKVYPECCR